jgi:GxxExxY protein
MQSHGKIPDLLTERIIGAAIEVHRQLGPGLLESIYEECLCLELADAGIAVVRQTLIPVVYKARRLAASYRADLIVANEVVVEIKSNEKLVEVHQAQLLTYLRVTGLHTGLLFNFNTAVLSKGIKRISL